MGLLQKPLLHRETETHPRFRQSSYKNEHEEQQLHAEN